AGRSVDVALGWLVAVNCHVGVTVGRLVAVAAAVDVGTAVGVATGGLVAVAVGVAVGLDGAASIMRGAGGVGRRGTPLVGVSWVGVAMTGVPTACVPRVCIGIRGPRSAAGRACSTGLCCTLAAR